MALTASPNPAITGQNVTYAATVSPAPASGTVAFADGGNTISGCGSVSVAANGTVQCQVSYSQDGTHTITAAYHPGAGSSVAAPAVSEIIVACGHAFQGCNLSGLDLANADFKSADLAGSNLQNTDLAGADLADADLAGANLQGANLQGANLQGASLADADLQGANLQNADLAGADLASANLGGANLGGATWSGTTCPDGTSSDNDGGICQKNL